MHILMRRQGMTQSELAQHLHIDQASVSKKLYGRRTWTLDELLAAAMALDVPVTDLLPGDDYAPVLVGRGREVSRARRDSNPQPSDWESDTFWTVDRIAWLGVIECQAYLDGASLDSGAVS